ncbi:MAG: STAS domain-containing protein [candidate division Zixibacteria bacterium]|nr:STAS domain-containing protein [Candidatus Tariuqbacter arcticus]
MVKKRPSLASRRESVIQRIPILKIRNYLIIPIQIDLDDLSAAQLQKDILQKIDKTGAQGVIIDVSVVEMIDSYLGRILGETARMAALMDAKVVLCGMQPAVAITLVELGLSLEGVHSALNLEGAITMMENILGE